MYRQETVIISIRKPTAWKADLLDAMAHSFRDAVQIGLDVAQELRTSSRGKIHKAGYANMRSETSLPSDYARMAVNQAVALARSYYGLRKSKRQKRTSFPVANGANSIGLGTNAYALVDNTLRVSTGVRGQYIWLSLSVHSKIRDKLQYVKGDAKLFRRNKKWYVMLPLKIPHTPPVCDGESSFIGVDLGIVRLATVCSPHTVQFFDGKAIRHRREHFANLRKRYQRHGRIDKVKQQKGKESRWIRNINHVISKRIVDIALQHENPVVVFERLDGIRDRVRASKRFNRMMASWSFRQLVDMTLYKAEQHGISVLFIDPRGTSKTCCKCGHATRSNRPSQSDFRCVSCGYQSNADLNAAVNIAAAGLHARLQEPPDTARLNKPDGEVVDLPPDAVQDVEFYSTSDRNLASSL